MGLWPVLPGFVRSIKGTSDNNGWDHLYQLSTYINRQRGSSNHVVAMWSLTRTEFTCGPYLYCLRHLLTPLPITFTYFYGFFVAGLVYYTLHTTFAVPRQTGYSPFVLAEHIRMLEEQERGYQAGDSPEPVDVVPTKLEI
jgi:NCS1 family nucleobase:cation symporter-1